MYKLWRSLGEGGLASGSGYTKSLEAVFFRAPRCKISPPYLFFHPLQQTIICSGSFSRAHRIAPVQILHADTNQTNDCMQIRVSVEEKS